METISIIMGLHGDNKNTHDVWICDSNHPIVYKFHGDNPMIEISSTMGLSPLFIS